MRGSFPAKEFHLSYNTAEGTWGKTGLVNGGRKGRQRRRRGGGKEDRAKRNVRSRVQASCNPTSSDVCRAVRHKETANGRSEKGFLVLETEWVREEQRERERERERESRDIGNILIFIYDW